MEGWIALHRSIMAHWVWRSHYHAKRWIDILFLAAWNDHDVDLGTRKVHLCRGQFITSTRQLMALWKTNTTTVLDFLRALEKSEMIKRKRSGNMTIITVCNYNKYQGPNPDAESPVETPPILPVKPTAYMAVNPTQESDNSEGDIAVTSQDIRVTSGVTIEQNKINNNNNNNTLISPDEREKLFFEEVKKSTIYLEGVAKNFSLTVKETIEWLEKFYGYVSTVGRSHNDVADFKDHFYKWLDRKLETAKQYGSRKQKSGGGQSGTQDRYAARRGTDVGDKKASDYGGSF